MSRYHTLHPSSEAPAWKHAFPEHHVDEGKLRLACALQRAWNRYSDLFGANPHGSEKQLLALLELMPEAKVYVALYEKNREEGMTV